MKDLIFKERVEKFLLEDESNKQLQRVSIDFDTNLWNEGLVDSFRIMELVFFLEDLLGREIAFEHNIIGSFQSIRMMHNLLVLESAPQ
jgi:acyl carrier protein